MKKAEALNTFADGMVMDINPLVMPNSGLCNALNATLITFNGNENVLQNDMGNGRVETAYLPEGYVPMGTAELGGIVYIVSYNPLTDKCQIGSFPSPERNITSDEISEQTKTISNNSFQGEWTIDEHHKIIKSSIVKLKLLDDEYKLYPGDKYKIYSDGVIKNVNYLSDCQKGDAGENITNYFGCHPRNVTIHVVSLGDDGKITYLDSNQKWNYKESVDGTDITTEYYISNTDNLSDKDNIKKDIDSYRSLVTTAYNIFNSKVSGELALLFEVEIIKSFELTWDAEVEDVSNGDYDKQATIYFNSNWTSDDPIINPSYLVLSDSKTINGKLVIPDTCQKGCYENYPSFSRKNDGESDKDVKITVGRFQYESSDLENYIWNYSVVPAMKYGIMSQYEVSGSINFSEIGSGKIELIQWKYYIEDNDFYIKLGIDAYPEKNKKIYWVKINFIPIENVYKELFKKIEDTGKIKTVKIDDKDCKKSGEEYTGDEYTQYSYTIDGKSSYSGYFQELLMLGSGSPTDLQRNKLYVVDIVYKYGSNDLYEFRHQFKFLYTIKIFNHKYLNGPDDFSNIKLSDEIFNYIQVESNCEETLEQSIEKSESFYPGTPNDKDATCYGCQYVVIGNKNNLTVNNIPSFKKYSELFSIVRQNEDKVNVSIEIPENPITNTATITSDDSNTEKEKISPILMTKADDYKNQDPDKWATGTGSDFEKAQDQFKVTPSSKTGYSCEFKIQGSYYNKLNAVYTEKDITAQSTVTSVIANKTDLENGGGYSATDQTAKMWFAIGNGNNKSGDDWTLTFYPIRNEWGTALHAEDFDWDGYDDRNQISNWWDNLSNDPGNVWTGLQNTPKNQYNFPVIEWYGRDDGWIKDDDNNKNITNTYAIWAATDGGHLIPLNTQYKTAEEAGKAVVNFLTQIYHVDTSGTTYKGIRVKAVAYLTNFKETWKIKINSEFVIDNPNNTIYIDKKSLSDIINNIDEEYISNTFNIDAGTYEKTSKSTTINFQHTFKSDSTELQEKFQSDKQTTVGCLFKNNWTGTSEETVSRNSNNLYIVNPDDKSLYIANPTNLKNYLRKNCSFDFQDTYIKMSGGTKTNKDTKLINYLVYQDSRLLFKESGLQGSPKIRFSDTDGEGDKSYWIITNNTTFEFPL